MPIRRALPGLRQHFQCVLFLTAFCCAGVADPPPATPAAANPTNLQIVGNPAPPETPAPAVCPAGGPIGAVNLRVHSPKTGDQPLPLEFINNLSEGDTVLYSPLIRGKEVRHGEVALVLVPVHASQTDPIIVTDPKSADKPQEWKIDRTIGIVAYVYGAEGLNKKRVRGFLMQDDLLIAQLADYAEKLSQTEALIAALSDQESTPASINAALTGFASQYGLSAPIDHTQPASVQAQMLFSTMNPQLAAYDPLTPSTSARLGQTASLATVAAGMFFGSPIGLAAGGTAMLLDLRAIAFPGTQFRSSFAQELKPGLNLCGQRNPAPPHTRVAYIWATRIPNQPPPVLKIGPAHYLPTGERTAVPIDTQEKTWHYLDRAREWTLANSSGRAYPIKVVKLANQKSIELDLPKDTPPGDYKLKAFWDWRPLDAEGTVSVRSLNDFKDAKLEASSQDRLLAKSGKIPVTVEGGDFEFTNKVELKKSNDEFAVALPIPFVLPKGARLGEQSHMDVQINTAELEPGDYQLLISQADNKQHPVQIKVLPSPPEIDNLPILANQGASEQHFVLKGKHLGLLAKLEAPGVGLQLGPIAPDDSERNLTVRIAQGFKPGSEVPISEFLHDRTEPLVLPRGLKITGPKPVIASSRLSLPTSLPITLEQGEFPAGSTLTALLDVKNLDVRSTVHLTCEGDGPDSVLHIGEQTEKWSVQQLSPDQLFISYDTSGLPAGCSVQATVENRGIGESQPYILARIIRIPAIDQFALTQETTPDGKHIYTLTGRNLEMVEKVGWDQLTGFDVSDLPAPVPGAGQEQILRVKMTDAPAPSANLYVWLRGDHAGRGTTVLLTPPPPATAKQNQ